MQEKLLISIGGRIIYGFFCKILFSICNKWEWSWDGILEPYFSQKEKYKITFCST